MRSRVWIYIFSLVTLGIALQGCVLTGMLPGTPTPTLVLAIETQDNKTTDALTPTPAEASTGTPLPEPTATPSPVKYPETATEFVSQMLETNGECELPCWWGITPGENSWTEIQAGFSAAGLPMDGETLDLHPWKDITGHHVEVEFQRDSDVVRDVRIKCTLDDDVIFVDGMIDLCGSFALPAALSHFGIPSHVDLSMNRLDSFYDLWMAYENAGITLSYPGLMVTDVEGWYICPVPERQNQIIVQLYSPGTGPANAGLGVNDGVFISTGSLEMLTGVAEEEFHVTYSQPETRSCLFAGDAFQRYYEEILAAPEGTRLGPQAETGILINALYTNLNCDLPCWWGITPGKTRWDSVRDQFLSYGKTIAVYSDNALNLGGVRRVSLFGRHDPHPFEYMLEHEIYEYSGFVNLLGARARTFGGEPMGDLLQDWERYTISHILARFGIPSEVLLHYWSDSPHSPYTVGLIYERDGLMVEYEGQIIPDPGANQETISQYEKIIICLDEEHISGINVWSRSRWGFPALAEVFKQLGGYYPKHFYSTPSLEEATGMSLDVFYEKFLDPDPYICLVADGKLGDLSE